MSGVVAEMSEGAEAASGPSARDKDEPVAMTFPHLLLRELIALVGITVVLSALALAVDAPLLEIANPDRTPNPSKAPWYFLGLQELLHYYHPAISGVFIPLLMLVALAAVPYFVVNLERRPMWDTTRRWRRVASVVAAVVALTALLLWSGAHPVWPMIVPVWVIGSLMLLGAVVRSKIPWVCAITDRSLPFWVFTWFLLVAVTLTVIGTFFRGPGWTLVLPWRDGLYL